MADKEDKKDTEESIPKSTITWTTPTIPNKYYVEKRIGLLRRIVKQINYSDGRTAWLVTLLVDNGRKFPLEISSSRLYSESEYADAFDGEFPPHEE